MRKSVDSSLFSFFMFAISTLCFVVLFVRIFNSFSTDYPNLLPRNFNFILFLRLRYRSAHFRPSRKSSRQFLGVKVNEKQANNLLCKKRKKYERINKRRPNENIFHVITFLSLLAGSQFHHMNKLIH